MRPLETHVKLASHVWMYNRVKELLVQEGLLPRHASEENIRHAVSQWLDLVTSAEASDDPMALPH